MGRGSGRFATRLDPKCEQPEEGPLGGRDAEAPRVAFVTGAGSGIGRVTALRLAHSGAAVAAFDLDGQAAEAVAREIEEGGGRALAQAGDVTRSDDLESAVAQMVAEFGGLDAVAACAGLVVAGTAETTSDADWDRAIAVNLTGVMLTARHAIPALVAGGGGAFVAIASEVGVTGTADSLAYAAAKHGVVGLVRCLAVDHASQGVRSNVVCPSLVRTPMADRVFELIGAEVREASERQTPFGRFATAEEVAAVVHHLLSPESSYTNGLVYRVDAGKGAGAGA